MENINIIEEKVEYEVTIEKSKFITWLYPVVDEKEAKEYIQLARTKHPKAVHHTYAYIIRKEYQNIENQSDDGEPSKTAGMPMLDILRYENLVNVVAIVIRYFGGIKLGVGGLIRAYGGSVKSAVDHASIKQAILMQGFEVRVSYSFHSMVEYEIKKYHGVINKIDYLEEVNIIFYSKDETIINIIKEKTNNQLAITKIDRVYM
ncbi:YigZ family protein [Mycoplasma sp. P36-A1]|uniref:YigZ family protein n=1 Tax=Mycoplasma sp. P36-A1 TaxID=3252900 RepID=UPI003C2AD87E